MARTKGSKNKPKGQPPGTMTEHETKTTTDFTDDHFHALVGNHARKYKDLLDLKKTADATLKNHCKLAKAEGVPLDDIKAYLDAQTEEGQKRLQEQAERLARMARWHSFALGTQADMFPTAAAEGDDDPPPAQNRSYRLGKEAGIAGEKPIVPGGCDPPTFMSGYHEGQASLAGALKQLETEPADPDL